MESFEIFVRSPFGKYRGTISFTRNNGIVTGTMSFLAFSSDFSGAASSGDELSFKGAMDTPVGRIEYDARASVHGNSIEGTAMTRLGTMTFSSREGR